MISVVGYVDFNVPVARQSKAAQSLVSGMSIVNDMGNPASNCCLMILLDLPKESSLRGLFDEEKAIIESCFGLKQHVETRWIDLYTRDKRSDARSNVRRFGQGRIVVHGDAAKNNIWLQSELAVCGRPVGQAEYAPTSVLPKTASLLILEASSPDSGIRLAESVDHPLSKLQPRRGVRGWSFSSRAWCGM